MGKTSILTIAIQLVKQGNGDQATVKALAQLKSGFNQAAAVMGAIAGVGVTLNAVYKQTAGVFMDYAAQVLATSRATGLSAQESSRLLQVTDDLGISYESLAKAIKSSADSTNFSVEGLAQASSQYLALTNAQERAAFAQKAYGKSWVDMVAVLEKGPDKIRDMSSAVDENLVLTEQSVSAYEKYRLQVDELNDRVLALKVSIGSQLVPALSQAVDNYLSMADAMDQASEATGRTDQRSRIYLGTMLLQRQAALDAAQATADHADRLNEMPAAVDAATSSLQEEAAALDVTSRQYQSLIDLTGQVQSVEDNYINTVRAQFQVQADLNAQLAQGKITQEEYNQRIAEAGAAVTQAAAEHEAAANRILFSIIQMKMAADGLSAAEGDSLINIGVELGIFTKESADKAKGFMQKADEMIASAEGAGTGIEQAFAPAQEALSETKNQAHGLKEQLDSIEKKNGRVVVFTVIINTVGSVPNLPGSGGNSEACFVAGTLVDMADGSRKPIEEVRAGDLIRSADLERGGALIEAGVGETFEHAPETVPYTLRINGLRVTGEHLLLVNGQWTPADDVRVGDFLRAADGEAVRVESVERAEGGLTVYNLHTDHASHNYFAGGVLVHNAKRNENSGQSMNQGGQLQLGRGWTLVGDGPGGQWTPYAELIDPNGYVHSNKESEALMRAGLVPEAKLREGGQSITPSAGEAAYYRTVTPRSASGVRSRRPRGNMPTGRRGGADEGGQVTPVSPVDPLVTATDANTSAMTQAASAQAQATQQQTSVIAQSNNDMVEEMRGMRTDIRRLMTTIPQSMREAVQQVV